MKILIDIQTIKGSFTYRGPIRIRIKLGDSVSIWTEAAHYNEGMYAFLEKHLISINQKSMHSYLQLSIIGQNGNNYGQITVFLEKFKDFNSIEIKNDGDSYKLAYTLKEIMDDSQQIEAKSPTARKTIEAEPPNMNEQAHKLQIFRLGILMYNFAQRLDPLVYVYNKILSIVLWKDPILTVVFGVFLTIVIYYMKTSILIGGIGLYFGKQVILKKISTIHRFKNFHKRIIVPKQNAYFLQNGMDNYCELYQKVTGFLFDDDKTLLINLIKFICKTCVGMILLLYLFSIESIIIITIWTILIITSPQKDKVKSLVKPIFTLLIGEYYKISDRITEGISNMIGSQLGVVQQKQISKIFYFYQYERWWVVKGWCDQTKKFSDQNYQAIIFPRERAPQGWGWIQEWKIDLQGEVDSQGYQYSNDLMTEFVNKSALMTRRRRKWKRTCVKLRNTD